MISRSNIRHAALLKPSLTKCLEARNGRHDYTALPGGYEQCINCGYIKKVKG